MFTDLEGFTFGTVCKIKKVYICRIIAKIPTGRSIVFATNSIGTGGSNKWLTPTSGTGDWCEYIHKVNVGTGSLSSSHYYYLNGSFGTPSSPVKWYLAYATVFDLTDNEKFTTTINSEGIYTSSINATQIKAGIIDTARLNVGELKSQLITASNINALNCTFKQGTIGGWNIGEDNISCGKLGEISSDIPIQIRTKGSGTGDWYRGLYKPYGICMTWHKASNAGHLVLGEVAANGTTKKEGFAGLQMMSWLGHEYFCLAFNHSKSGSMEVYNRIAGWRFDNEKIWKNNITLGSDGSIGHTTAWKLNNDGSGSIANGNISWNATGVVSFGSSVSLNWTNAANNALNSAKTYADTKKTEAINSAAADATTKAEAAKEVARAMAFGKMLYRVPEFFLNGSVHFNSTLEYLSNGTRTLEKVSGCPNTSGYAMKISVTNWQSSTDHRLSGFSFRNQSRANAVFIARLIALIPVGRNIQNYHNNYGTGQNQKWLTTTEGTGKWEEYICKVNWGSTGTFSTINHFALTGGAAPTTANPCIWYVAFATVYDVTACESYTTTIDVNGIYTGKIRANQIHIDSALVVGGSTYDGSISVRDASNTVMATLDRRGITAVAGTIGGWTINTNQISKNGVVLEVDGTISNGTKWKMGLDGSGYVGNGNIKWNKDGDVTVKGTIETKTGNLGGFEIGDYRIGKPMDDTIYEMSLTRYKARFGNDLSYIYLGRGCQLSTDLGVTASARLVNINPLISGTIQTNIGMQIDVRGGSKNFGIISNAPIIAPMVLGNEALILGSALLFSDLPFDTHNIFHLNIATNISVYLPTEKVVANRFGLVNLPSNFAFTFTFVTMTIYTNTITINDVMLNTGVRGNVQLKRGNIITFLCCAYPHFCYKVISLAK